MLRDAHIPLFLWIATALLVHLLGGGGASQAANWIEERIELRRFAENVRSFVKTSHSTMEVALLDPTPPPDATNDVPPPPEPTAEPKEDEESPQDEDKPEPLPEPKKTPEPKPQPEPEPEKKPEEEQKKADAEKVVPKQQLVLQKKISVRQHVEDQNQKDNPDAEFLADQNNHVREQTRARITSNDQEDPNPTPGSNSSGVGEQPGDSRESRVAQSEDRPGEEARAPSSDPAKANDKAGPVPPNAGAARAAATAHTAPAQTGTTTGVQKPPEQRTAESASPLPGSKGQAEQHAQAGSPELMAAHEAAWLAARAEAAQAEQQAMLARKRRELPRRKARGFQDLLGLGASGTTANGVNLNLTPGLAREAIGDDQLARERLADGARRRSQHLGSWKTTGIERWRSAIENYVPSVKPGNQTALNTARAPFAAYLAAIHNRLHPIFADWFLASLDSLPQGHPMNNPELNTSLEIVLDQDEGRIVRMGITKTSGVTAFDIAALDSVQRASPFGPPPREIVSPDGNVYLHWEFHRNPIVACTTWNARPYMLKAKPNTAPPDVHPPSTPPNDGPAEEQRHGLRATPNSSKLKLAQTP
jgi:hypothetical protein